MGFFRKTEWGVSRFPGGGFRLSLSPEEREVLRGLPDQLEEVFDAAPDDPSLRRLSPPAYTDQPDHEAEYRRYMGDDLRQRQRDALAVLRETAGAEELSEEQAQGWLSALNSLRLVLGTQLDITEGDDGLLTDPADPRAPGLAVYGYLSWLLDQLVDALAEGLPHIPPDPTDSR
ncbi:MAG: DUF2017 family protein [Acidimicrobiales bacterium]